MLKVYTDTYDHRSTLYGSSDDDDVIALKASSSLNHKIGGTTSGVFYSHIAGSGVSKLHKPG